MSVAPDFPTFKAAYESGAPQVVWTELVADLETPVSAMLKLADGRANAFLLESVEGGAVNGRYSIITREPDVVWRCQDGGADVARGETAGGEHEADGGHRGAGPVERKVLPPSWVTRRSRTSSEKPLLASAKARYPPALAPTRTPGSLTPPILPHAPQRTEPEGAPVGASGSGG